MSESYFKDNEVTLIISATDGTTPHRTGTTYFTFARNVGKQVVNLRIRGTDGVRNVNLNDVEAIKMYYHFTDASAKHLSEDYTVIDASAGKFHFMLNNDKVDYTGEVLIYFYIILKERTADGKVKSFDAGAIGTTYRESLIDADLPELAALGWDRLERLEEELQKHVESVNAEMNRDLATVRQGLTTAQSDINRIQSQINDNDIPTKEEVYSAGFGENNLIRNSSEPIIINPTGNLSSASHVIHNDLDLGTTYSYTAEVKNLRGIDKATFRVLGADSPNQTNNRPPVQETTLDIVDGKVSIVFTTPPVGTFPTIQICINAGTRWNETLGNTLEVRNQMLIKGTKDQPYRPAHEDNTERLDKIEALIPNIRRTVATFEGIVNRPYEDGGHFAIGNVSNRVLLSPANTFTQFTNTNYEIVSTINNRTATYRSGIADGVVQVFLRFDIIEHLERNYSETIWQGHTALADKVRIARQIVKRIACVWDGYGITNGNGGVVLRPAESLANWAAWNLTHNNTTSQRTTLQSEVATTINWMILSDGTCRFLVHTATGQTTPIGGATLVTEFVQFEVDVETTLASTDWSYSKAETDRHLQRYLPLTGGTLTGDLTRGHVRIGNDWAGTHNAVAFHVRSGTNRTAARFGEGNLDMHVGANSLFRVFQINSTSIFRPVRALNFQTADGNTRLINNGVGTHNDAAFHLRRNNIDILTVRNDGLQVNTQGTTSNNALRVLGTQVEGRLWGGTGGFVLEAINNGTSTRSLLFRTGGQDRMRIEGTGIINAFSSMNVTGNITASRLIGNADTATRLQTPRLLNGVADDGSTDITITANPAHAILPSSANLNTVLAQGFYGGNSSNWTNKPTGAMNWVGLRVEHRNPNPTNAPKASGVQVLTSSEGRQWIRSFSEGVFNQWIEVPSQAGNTVFNMTVARATSIVNTFGQEINVFNELTECKKELEECKCEIADLKSVINELIEMS